MARRVRSMFCKSAATAILACVGAASAEPPKSLSLPQWIVRAQERLALDRAQQRELRALLEENTAGLRALQLRLGTDSDPGDVRALRDQLASLQQEFREKLGLILRPEQVAEWDALLEELMGEVHLRNAPRLAETLH